MYVMNHLLTVSSDLRLWIPLASSHGEERGVPCLGQGWTCLDNKPLAGSRFEWERLNPTGCPGKVSLDKVKQRYFLLSTSSNPVQMFNPGVLEQRTGSRIRR